MAPIPHQPERPSWDCDCCGRPWPCDPARERLRAEGAGTSLAIMMWSRLEEAMGELPRMEPREVFDRFIAWTR